MNKGCKLLIKYVKQKSNRYKVQARKSEANIDGKKYIELSTKMNKRNPNTINVINKQFKNWKIGISICVLILTLINIFITIYFMPENKNNSIADYFGFVSPLISLFIATVLPKVFETIINQIIFETAKLKINGSNLLLKHVNHIVSQINNICILSLFIINLMPLVAIFYYYSPKEILNVVYYLILPLTLLLNIYLINYFLNKFYGFNYKYLLKFFKKN